MNLLKVFLTILLISPTNLPCLFLASCIPAILKSIAKPSLCKDVGEGILHLF